MTIDSEPSKSDKVSEPEPFSRIHPRKGLDDVYAWLGNGLEEPEEQSIEVAPDVQEPVEAPIENDTASTVQPVDRGAVTDEEKAEPVACERQTRTIGRLAQHLLQAGNNVESLLVKAAAHPENEQDYLREAAVLACDALLDVWQTPTFYQAIRMLVKVWHQNASEIDSVFAEFDIFLEIERKLLTAIGMPEVSANKMTMNCREILESTRRGEVSSRRLIEAIAEVTRETCKMADDLKQRKIQASESERAKQRIVRAGKAIGGVGLAALNASVFAAGFTSPLSPAMAAVSSVFGAEMIKAALADS